MVVTQKLTAETFLSLPRRSDLVPNGNGTLGFYRVSTHDFGDGKTKKEWKLMALSTGSSWQLVDHDKVHDVNWLPVEDSHDTVIWLKSGDEGVTELIITSVTESEGVSETYVAAKFDAPVDSMKLQPLDDGTIAFAVVGLAAEDGSLYNEETHKPRSTARIYDNITIREVCLLICHVVCASC
jgi:hypothetical protein